MKQARFAGALCAIVLVFASAVRIAQAQDFAPEVLHYADMVFYNGHVLTMDRDQAPFTVTEALAVRDGKILAVGEDERILRPESTPQTSRVVPVRAAAQWRSELQGERVALRLLSYPPILESSNIRPVVLIDSLEQITVTITATTAPSSGII